MDFFQHPYYKLNKILLQLCGLWPYQNIRARVVITAAIMFLIFSILIPQVIVIIKNFDDRDFIVECAMPLIFMSACVTKFFISIVNSSKVLELLNHMRMDWKLWGRDRDVDILHKYVEKGRMLTKLYTVVLMTNSIFYATQPVIPKIIDVLFKNGTKPGQLPIAVDYYYIDVQKNYFYVITHCGVCIFFGFLVSVAFDSMLIVYVQHGCGLFAILRRKLERMGQNEMSAETDGITCEMNKPAIDFGYLVWCIDKHNRAIEYVELIDATFSWCFFFVAAFNTLLISVEGVQIIERTSDLAITIKLILSIISALVHLYMESYIGQILIDHSISIGDYLLNGKWYVLPLRIQKLLPLIIMRSNISCKLTFARLTAMSVETFVVILKTSLSYFTLLRSV